MAAKKKGTKKVIKVSAGSKKAKSYAKPAKKVARPAKKESRTKPARLKTRERAKKLTAKAPVVEKVIPLHMIPDKGYSIEKSSDDKKDYLVVNEAMYTFYRRTRGELSPYFLGIVKEKKLYGAKCPKCGAVRVPPFMVRCPDCDFVEMELVEVPDRGRMLHTPPITYFAHSIFQDMAPFGRGRVVLGDSITALPILVYTTKGVLRPGIFSKGTPVKIVFRSNRTGSPRDIFAVPESELTKEQIEKPGLEESELDWDSPEEPQIGKPTPELKEVLNSVEKNLDEFCKKVKGSYRAQKDLAGWKRKIQIKTAAGNFYAIIDDGKIDFGKGNISSADLTMVTDDPGLFNKWMNSQEALTNAIITGKLWISKNSEFKTVFKLDRLPRSLRRA